MNKYLSSRGWRNCNPLNIRHGDKWQGLRYTQTDKLFCQFLTMSWGYRAAVKCLQPYFRYFKQAGKEWTIDNIINRWAPPNENDTAKYLVRVCEIMGREFGSFRLADPYTTPGRLQLAIMVAAMTCVECGCPPSAVPIASLNTGFVLAGLGSPGITSDWWK